MEITLNDVIENIRQYFRDSNSEIIITKRIENKLGQHILSALSDLPDMTEERFKDAINDFLSGEGVVSFILERQPAISPVSDEVKENVKRYFATELSEYEPVAVYRKSNHPEDSYLYMVSARNTDGMYACWTSFNTTTQSLNYGHYNLTDLPSCNHILEEYFNDITDEPEKYGMKSTMVLFETQEKIALQGAENEVGEVISIHRRKPGR